MLTLFQRYTDKLATHRYAITMAAYIIAAFITGVACVLFMRAFAFADAHRLDFVHIGWWCLLFAPILFCAASALVRYGAPCASGSGIPQAIYVVRTGADGPLFHDMTSPVTLMVKTVSILFGVWAGASVGREGPTVQVAMCMMFLCMALLKKILPITPNPRSLALAGGAAGLAAAFNTPLAGVTFAIEELSSGYFESIKDYVLMAIIIAALSAKVLTGEYIYFGRLPDPPSISIAALVLISITAGLAGLLFSVLMLKGTKLVASCAGKWWFWLIPAGAAVAVIGLAWAGGAPVQGPGNGAAQNYLSTGRINLPLAFPAAKLLSTVISYCSGIAGGIFAPSLSIGAGMGAFTANFFGYPIQSCALVGMSAFLCGAIQSPMTSFVIIFELTGHHGMLLPVMLASLIAYMIARALRAKSFYSALADRYGGTAIKR